MSRLSTVLLLAIVAVQGGCVQSRSRCAVEGQAAVETFLRTGAGGAITNYGSFLRLEGSGFVGAVWNIQGYEYISLQRTAYYSGGSFPMVIYVTEGRLTAPGLKTVGVPRIESMLPAQGARIFVSHPGLR